MTFDWFEEHGFDWFCSENQMNDQETIEDQELWEPYVVLQHNTSKNQVGALNLMRP